MDTLDQLVALKNAAEARLHRNPDYVELKVLERAIQELMNVRSIKTPAESTYQKISRNRVFHHSQQSITQSDAAEKVLLSSSVPLPTSAMLGPVRDMGAQVGGKDPLTNLASSLSRDPRFIAVRFDSKPAWWLRDKAIPGDLPLEPRNIQPHEVESAEGNVSSADSL